MASQTPSLCIVSVFVSRVFRACAKRVCFSLWTWLWYAFLRSVVYVAALNGKLMAIAPFSSSSSSPTEFCVLWTYKAPGLLCHNFSSVSRSEIKGFFLSLYFCFT
jgi:uncharacterized membrane protein